MGVFIFFLLRFLIPSLDFKDNLRIGQTGRYTVSDLPNSILRLAGNGLTQVDSEGSVIPDLASSWETTDKGKTWIFTIKDDIYWQDGDKVTSETINYQFSDVSIERPDEQTIIFKLDNTYSAFPSVVSKPTFKSGLLGTGNWKVEDISLNGPIVEQISLSSKDEGSLIYKFYPTEESAKTAFQLGEIDQIEDVFSPSPFDTWKRVRVAGSPDFGEFVAVFFNTQDSILAEKEVRQALTYAIDKESLGDTRAISPIAINSWAYNSQVKQYNFDPDKAREMINNYKETSNQQEITINLATPSLLLGKAEQISENWRSVGVNVNLQVVTITPTDYQSFLAILDIPEDPDQYSLWHSTQTSTNITHYQDVRIDKLLEDGRSEIDLTSRKKIYMDFQRFLVEDSPAAFLYYPTVYSISRR